MVIERHRAIATLLVYYVTCTDILVMYVTVQMCIPTVGLIQFPHHIGQNFTSLMISR